MHYFIVNPSSQSGHGMRVWQQVEAELENTDVEYRVYFTSEHTHATEITREITTKEGRHTVVALGGDGTVNEVINGIQDFERTIFAYIPSGSSNDFARSLGLPSTPTEALSNILHPTYYAKIDLGELTCGEKTRLFAGSCGIGFDAAVCHAALRSRIKKFLNRFKLGKLTYVGIALRQLITLTPFQATLHISGSKKQNFPKTFFISILNGPYEGGGLKMCPKANPSDGFLDICSVARLNRLLLALVLPTAYLGWHVLFPCVRIRKGSTVQIHTPAPLPVHVDGESFDCQTDLSIRCLPGRLRIIAGKSHTLSESE